jgi:hypothetical protein
LLKTGKSVRGILEAPADKQHGMIEVSRALALTCQTVSI